MDRIADGAVFGAVAYWLAIQGRHLGRVAALVCLVAGQVVSYVKARAEGLGFTANVGIAERTERLILARRRRPADGVRRHVGPRCRLWAAGRAVDRHRRPADGHVYARIGSRTRWSRLSAGDRRA